MNRIKDLALAAVLFGAAALGAPAFAQATMDHAMMGDMKTAQGAAAEMADGEVRKIDKEAGKLTLKHGEIKNLGMPGMTMVFVVKDKAMLNSLKTGDKIKFKVINDAGKFTVTEIAPAEIAPAK